MGVHGLWELLAPVGRRVSVETLAGKKLAIDASIWMVQFMKAMRDEKGEMVHNAHLIGFFRRICKLLFLRTKPVFVFDGATPGLKRRTLAARRRHRDNAQAKIRKTAEKLLLNHLKARKLEELAAEIKNSRRQDDDLKGKKVMDESKGKQVLLSGEESGAGGSGGGQSGEKAGGGSTQESLDELLAASLAAEEERKFNESELASAGDEPSVEEGDDDDDDDDENEEMIFPIANGKIDPTVLASLPPSMQLDLLVQMRERVMAENRQRYQKIKKAPAKFSELQIQSYLKTVAFRREIDEVQKAAGRGLGGVQTSRIASEANREFIFSSSFTGDKQTLTSRGVEKSGKVDHCALEKPMISNPASQSKSVTDVSVSELIREFGPDVETYCDERGRVRVSRVRGLGMRMTRDIQRNLDLMKEYEREKVWGDSCKDPEPTNAKEVPNVLKSLSENSLTLNACISNERNGETTSTKNGALILEDENHHFDESPALGNKNAIEISFVEDDSGMKDMDDNLFLHLVSGSPTSKLFDRSSHPDRSTSESESECIWEEGMVEGNAGSQKSGDKESQSFLAERNSYVEDEVDWEDGVCHVPNVASSRQAKPEKAVSIGLLEEEADLQEAIRRSLDDFEKQKSSIMTSENQILGKSSEDRSFVGSLFNNSNNSTLSKSSRDTDVPLESHIGRSLPLCATVDEHGQHDNASRKDVLQMTDSGKKHLSPSTSSRVEVDRKSSAMNDSKDDESGRTLSQINVPSAEPVDGHLSQIKQCCLDDSEVAKNGRSLISTNEFAETSYDISGVPDAVLSAAHHDDRAASQSSLSFGKVNDNVYSQKSSLVEEAVDNNGEEPEQVVETDSVRSKTTIQEYPNDHTELFEANLDNEISRLRQECFDLGNEQRKLERNAETVSSEMFAECQELLQMFGLPYIIAPMEAEAQCAYMEMTNLVDGVVTDDSDVFLFGARSVYKNIFDDRKYVETYFMKDIESELGLNREKIIRMGLLLGSDYTEGVSGIGIVNAIEVVHAFPEEDGLKKFREWIESPDPAILEKLDSHTGGSSRKRSSKASKENADGMRKNVELSTFEETVSGGHDDQPSVSGTQDIKDVFMSKHRNVSKNWHIPPSFPSESVITAYISPQVDESTEPFSWGKPDLVLLRRLCWERFGWGNQKADELLIPVLNEYNKHETQLRLEAFYTFNERFAKIRSQRIKKALKGITGTCSLDLTDDLVQEGSSSKKRRRVSPSIPEGSASDNCSNTKTKRGRQVTKQPRKQNTESKNMHPADVATESVILDESGRSNQSGLRENVRESGRGKGRARGRGRGRGRGISEEKLNYEPGDDTACSGASESHTEVPEAKSELRRSTRPRKHVKYAEEVLEVDELNVSSNQMDENDLHEVAVEHKLAEEDGSCTIRDSILDMGGSHPEDSLSRDDLLRGGGFCADKSEAQGDAFQPGDGQMPGSAGKDEDWVGEASRLDCGKEIPLKGNLSNDYLCSGGGFCVDESDLQGEAIQPAASLVMDVGPTGEMPCVSEDTQNLDLGCISGQQGTKRVSEDLVLDDLLALHGEVKPGLSAMPSLRRKRRKP